MSNGIFDNEVVDVAVETTSVATEPVLSTGATGMFSGLTAEAVKSASEFDELPDGDYPVNPTKVTIQYNRKGEPMSFITFRVLESHEFKNRLQNKFYRFRKENIAGDVKTFSKGLSAIFSISEDVAYKEALKLLQEFESSNKDKLIKEVSNPKAGEIEIKTSPPRAGKDGIVRSFTNITLKNWE